MAAGFENTPITQLISVLSLVLTVFLNTDTASSSLDVERLMHGEVWRLFTSQIIFRNKAQALVGLILLYSCRQFERQMGVKKFGAFLIFSLLISILTMMAFIVVCLTLGFHFVPSSGPFFLIFALMAFYYYHIPKMHSSQYAVLGFEFSEKSWIYLLCCQLLLSDGIASIVAALSGLLAGYLYDQDGYGIQSYRLPARLVSACGAISGFFNTLFPQARPNAGAVPRNPNAERMQQALNGNRQNLLNPYDMNNYRQGAPGGFNLNDLQQFHPLNDNTPNNIRAPQQPAVFVPNEGHIEMLMGMGFERDAVVRALQATGNNLEAAANILLR